jgi:hypothetical protein
MRQHGFIGLVGGVATAWPFARRARLRVLFLGVGAIVLACGSVRPQTATATTEPKPVFTPGLYQTESRNSAAPDKTVKSQGCVSFSGYDAFRDETMAQYHKSPRLMQNCSLSDPRTIKNGFAFSMQCKGIKTVLTYEFEKDLVRGTIDTLNEDAPKYSTSVLITMRRVGDCSGQEQGKMP